MTHVHTGHGPDNKLDCEGCDDEYHEQRAADMRHSAENTLIAEWFRENAPRFVEKFLSVPYPQVDATPENVEEPTGGDS